MAAHRRIFAFALGVSAILGFSAHALLQAKVQPTEPERALNFTPVRVDSAALPLPGSSSPAQTDVVEVPEERYWVAAQNSASSTPINLHTDATLVADVAVEPDRPRAVVLFLSGKSLGGAQAFRPGICSPEFGYVVAGDIRGSFSLQPGDQTWDLIVIAHELGHTFGSKHSHCYQKSTGSWYDQCYAGENGCCCYSGAVVPSKGTIMSYCQSMPPYMANIDPIAFRDAGNDPAMVNAMRSIAESMINGNPGGCLNVLDRSIYLPLVN